MQVNGAPLGAVPVISVLKGMDILQDLREQENQEKQMRKKVIKPSQHIGKYTKNEIKRCFYL